MDTKHDSHPLFQPIRIGDMTLSHRVVMAPMARFRADEDHVPTDLMVQYYSQRASEPGSFLITEATIIAAKAGGIAHCPGIWSKDQVAGWKKVVEAVHSKKSYIYLQLWALGRTANPDELKKEALKDGLSEDAYPYVAPSPVPMDGSDKAPRELLVEEIQEYVDLYVQAARNAVHGAGFDGVEIHGANGYLIDEFIQNVTNKRSDAYGYQDSPEARCRFALEVVDAVCAAVGPTKTSMRISPWSKFYGMREEKPIPTFSYLLSQMKKRQPRLSYVHVNGHTEELPPGISSSKEETDVKEREADIERPSTEPLRVIWKSEPNPGVFITCEGYTPERAHIFAKEKGDVIAFAKWYISNPDLPKRIRENVPLTPYDQSTFYSYMNPVGYIDYSFAELKVDSDESSESSKTDLKGRGSSGTSETDAIPVLEKTDKQLEEVVTIEKGSLKAERKALKIGFIQKLRNLRLGQRMIS